MSWRVVLDVGVAAVAQPRHQVGRVRNGGKKGRPVLFLPEEHPVHPYKAEMTIRARQAVAAARSACKCLPEFPFAGPVRLTLVFLLPRQGGAKAFPDRRWHDIRPDADNLTKSIKDAMTGVVWDDDCRVVVETAAKAYHDAREGPRVVAVVEPAGEVGAALASLLGAARGGAA